MKIDSHQHFWSIHRKNDYDFLTPTSRTLYRDYLPDDLRLNLTPFGINYSITVQAAQTIEETEWLLELVDEVDFVLGVVGWIELDHDQDTFLSFFEKLKKHKKFIGIRPMIQEIEDNKWILRENVISNLKILEKENFPLDLLVYPEHLPYVYEMLELVPNLSVVINHIAKPQIKDKQMDNWLPWMKKIGANKNVYCKLSGMVTEADHKNWELDSILPYVKKVIQIFGVDRVMYGSDWPVCRLAAEYHEVYLLLNEIVKKINIEDAKSKIFAENALRFYKLKI